MSENWRTRQDRLPSIHLVKLAVSGPDRSHPEFSLERPGVKRVAFAPFIKRIAHATRALSAERCCASDNYGLMLARVQMHSLTGCAVRFCRSHCIVVTPAVVLASSSVAHSCGTLAIAILRSCLSIAGPIPGKLCKSSGSSVDLSAGMHLRERCERMLASPRIPAACVAPRWVANSEDRESAPHVSINQRQTCPE